jgi:hypothetical protein
VSAHYKQIDNNTCKQHSDEWFFRNFFFIILDFICLKVQVIYNSISYI